MATLVKITDIEQMKTNFAQLENKEPKAVSAPDALQQMIKEINGALARGYSHEELYDLFIAGSGVEIGLATFRSYLNKANGKKKKRKPQPKLVITSAMTDAVKSKEVEKSTEEMAVIRSSENQVIAGQATQRGLPEVVDGNLSAFSNSSQPETSGPPRPAVQSDAVETTSDRNGICEETLERPRDDIDLGDLSKIMADLCDETDVVLGDDKQCATEVTT